MNCAVGLFSGVLVGRIHDKFFRRYKVLLLLMYTLAAASCAIFTLSTSGLSYFRNYSNVLVLVSNILSGFALNAFVPVAIEALGEVSYPCPEDIGSGLLALLNNIGCLIFIFVADYIPPTSMNWLLTGTAVYCFVMTLFVREKYTRTQIDLKAQAEADIRLTS